LAGIIAYSTNDNAFTGWPILAFQQQSAWTFHSKEEPWTCKLAGLAGSGVAAAGLPFLRTGSSQTQQSDPGRITISRVTQSFQEFFDWRHRDAVKAICMEYRGGAP